MVLARIAELDVKPKTCLRNFWAILLNAVDPEKSCHSSIIWVDLYLMESFLDVSYYSNWITLKLDHNIRGVALSSTLSLNTR